MRYQVLAGLALACAPLSASADVVYSANFDNVADAAGWTVNAAPTANAANQQATFGFDYSTFGIPAAPGGTGTLGMRLRANIPGGAASPNTTRPAGTTSGLSVSPTGQNFGNTYRITFYAWSNFNGGATATGLADNVNSEGGTNNIMMALGTSGTVPMVVGNTGLVTNGVMDGVGFATTGDGGIVQDYRVYQPSGTIATQASGVYAAGTDTTARENTNAYYTNHPKLGAHTAPAVQQSLSTAEYGSDAFNTQAGSTQPGSFGFEWHKVVLTKDGNTVTWDIDDVRIATLDASALTLGGANLALGVSDVNTSTTRHPSLLFTVFDNLTVENVVPEPSALSLLAVGGLGLLRRRRGK